MGQWFHLSAEWLEAPQEDNFTVIYVDPRGSGESGRPADGARMSQADMADDLDLLVHQLGFSRVSVLGHSDGGQIAIELATRHPADVVRLILVDTAILGDRGDEYTQATLELWKTDPRYAAAVEAAGTYRSGLQTDEEMGHVLLAMMPLYFGAPEIYMPVFLKTFRGTHLSSWADRHEASAEDASKRDQTRDLRKISSRTLFINGTADWVCPYQVAQRASAAIPNARLSLYANEGHFPWIENPSRFFVEVRNFLSEPFD